jgi:uncharacterized protein (DUF427 family)
MTDRVIKIPGPDHSISIAANPSRMGVSLNGQVLADTLRALTLSEAKYPDVHYIPRGDVDMAALTRSEHATYCPFKGDCSYYSLPGTEERGVNAVWTYEQPFPAVKEIAGHLAFYADRVEIHQTA